MVAAPPSATQPSTATPDRIAHHRLMSYKFREYFVPPAFVFQTQQQWRMHSGESASATVEAGVHACVQCRKNR